MLLMEEKDVMELFLGIRESKYLMRNPIREEDALLVKLIKENLVKPTRENLQEGLGGR